MSVIRFGNGSDSSSHGASSDPAYLPDVDYYRGILWDDELNRERIEAKITGGFDFDNVSDVRHRAIPTGGLLSRTILRRVTFGDDEGRTLPLELLLKIAHDEFEVVDTANRHHPSMDQGMQYQYDQMVYWNDLGLPSPIVFHSKQEAHQNHMYNYLVMEFWEGFTHDLNILALDEYGRNAPKDERDEFVTDQRERIILSSVDTIRNFHVIGTRGLGERPDIKSSVFVHRDLDDYFIEKRGRHYFERFLRLKLHGTGREGEIDGMLDTFCGLLVYFIQPFSNQDRLVYAQGDEYLHHLQYRQSNGSKITGMFDSDHVMMTRPEYSFAKLLTSYLLNLGLEDEFRFLTYAFSPKSGQESVAYDKALFGDMEQVKRDYFMVSLVTRLLDIGKRSSDALINDQRNARFVTGVPYRPHKLDFPSKSYVPVSVKYPSVYQSIQTQLKALRNRIDNHDMVVQLSGDDTEAVNEMASFLKSIELLGY